MAANTQNKKTAAERAAITKGKRNVRTPEFKRIEASGAEKAGDVTRMGTGRGEVISQVRESGAERMAREKADEARVARRERVDRWVKQIKDGKSKISDVPKELRPFVQDAMKEAPAPVKKKAEKKAAPKKADGVKSPAEIKAEIDKKVKAPKSTTRPIERAVSDATAKRIADSMKKDPWNKRPAPAAQESSKATAKPKKSATAPSAPKAKPTTTAAPKNTTFTSREFNSSAEGKKAIQDYKDGKITRKQLSEKQRAWSNKQTSAAPKGDKKSTPKTTTGGTKPSAPGTSVVPRPSGAVAPKSAGTLAKVGQTAAKVGMAAAKVGRFALLRNPYALTAATLAPMLFDKLNKEDTKTMRPAKAGELRGPVVSYSKGGTPVRQVKKTAAAAKPSPITPRADQGRDRGASAAANIVRGTVTKPKATSTVTVAKGDTLWGIARDNKTTVDALLKANPVLAQRKAAGKTVLFSNTKVRIPKKK